MYLKDKPAVKINNKMTETFPCYTGVKQGCTLSSTLLYLSVLPRIFKFIKLNRYSAWWLWKTYNSCLVYADDLVIFSRSANGLQTLLNKLESCCEKT